jgi:hypothetical protein
MAVLSAPKNKGALAVSYRPPTSWWGLGTGVAVETYPVKSGVFERTIPGYAVMNLGARCNCRCSATFRWRSRLQPLRRGAPGVRRGAGHRTPDHHARAGAVLASALVVVLPVVIVVATAPAGRVPLMSRRRWRITPWS